MKQTIFMALLLICSIGCKKKDEPQTELQLVSGKWYLETENGVEVNSCEKQSSIEFTADVRWLFRVYTLDEGDCDYIDGEGTYTLSSNTITVVLGTETATSTFSILGGILTVHSTNPDTGQEETATYDKTSG